MKLQTLIRNWRKRMDDYTFPDIKDSEARARYEGIVTGTRWCLEDAQKICKPRKTRTRKH